MSRPSPRRVLFRWAAQRQWKTGPGKPIWSPPRAPSVHDAGVALEAMEIQDKLKYPWERPIIMKLSQNGYVDVLKTDQSRKLFRMGLIKPVTLYAAEWPDVSFSDAPKWQVYEATPLAFALGKILQSEEEHLEEQRSEASVDPASLIWPEEEVTVPNDPWVSKAIPIPPKISVKHVSGRAVLLQGRIGKKNLESWVPKSQVKAVMKPRQRKPLHYVTKWFAEKQAMEGSEFWQAVSGVIPPTPKLTQFEMMDLQQAIWNYLDKTLTSMSDARALGAIDKKLGREQEPTDQQWKLLKKHGLVPKKLLGKV